MFIYFISTRYVGKRQACGRLHNIQKYLNIVYVGKRQASGWLHYMYFTPYIQMETDCVGFAMPATAMIEKTTVMQRTKLSDCMYVCLGALVLCFRDCVRSVFAAFAVAFTCLFLARLQGSELR